MNKNFKHLNIQDIIQFRRGKNITSSEMLFGEYPVISAGIEPSGFHNKFNVKAPSITISSSGANAGYLSFHKENIWAADCSYATGGNNIYFAYYLLKFLQPVITNLQRGAAQPHVYAKDVNALNISISNVVLNSQDKIANILSKYDDLIENNNKRIKLLEQMAENLYKEWFVRFRFPNYKKTKFVKGIPEGWRFIKVLEITNLKSGYAFSSEDFSDINGDCAVAKIKDISGLFMDTNDFSYVNEEKCKNAKKFILNIGDLTIALTGATIGKIGIVPNFDKKIYTNQRLGKFFNGENPINNLPYLFCLFSQKQIQQNILNISNSSSAQPNISPEQIENIKILSNKSIIEQFNNYTKSIFEQMIKLHDINKNLIKQRDLLLPRLMSGKLEV